MLGSPSNYPLYVRKHELESFGPYILVIAQKHKVVVNLALLAIDTVWQREGGVMSANVFAKLVQAHQKGAKCAVEVGLGEQAEALVNIQVERIVRLSSTFVSLAKLPSG